MELLNDHVGEGELNAQAECVRNDGTESDDPSPASFRIVMLLQSSPVGFLLGVVGVLKP